MNSRKFKALVTIISLVLQESTKDAEVISVAERSGHGGLQVYEFEYKVDSTRGGMKRIFSAAFVSSKKLYILNIAHSDKPESPLDTDTRTILEEVIHSFDAATMTWLYSPLFWGSCWIEHTLLSWTFKA